jgi:hypothetical protein
MSSDLSAEITAIATVVLATFAIVTAIFAILAFRKQSREVRAIERQVMDQEEVTRQQARLLELQAGQLELQRQQFEIQAGQLKVQRQQLDDQRAEQRRAQATRILISAEPRPDPETSGGEPVSTNFVLVTNTSQQPIYDLKFLFREADGEWTQLDEPDPPAPALMPGEKYQYPFEIDLPHLNFLLDRSLIAAGVVFRDASGVHWRLYSDGRLDEEPVTH